jgi:holo-[acyl-carrier protein] synthase
MTIYGIGTDITKISRIKKLLKNKKFIKRLFSKNEIKRCEKKVNKVNHYAKRFAAKEAFAKAIGVGVSKGISFNEIEVYNLKSGKPEINLIGKTQLIVKKILKKKKINIFLTLSDEDPFAIATVVICL